MTKNRILIFGTIVIAIVVGLTLSFAMFWNFANSPQRNEDNKSATVPVATTTPFVPPIISTPADNFERTRTMTFTSEILGVEFDYPLTMGILTEKILPPDDIGKGGPFERWSVSYIEPSMDRYSYFSIRADNKSTALSVWEGCGPMFKYYGQPLEDICDTEEFLNTDVYNIELNRCELRESEESVPYVYFEAKGVSRCEYGKSDKKSRIFSFIPQVNASTLNEESVYRYAGVFFKTQSDKWPGMSFTVNSLEVEGGEGAIFMLPYGSKVESGILPIQNIRLIENTARTLRHVK